MNTAKRKVFGRRLKRIQNLQIYWESDKQGFDYILNPATQELHRVGLNNFQGSHNLMLANLEEFIGIKNIGDLEIHELPDGASVPVYDLETGDFLGNYVIDKCLHCFP